MTDRVIRDIRFYELRPENYSGQFDGTLGNVYNNTIDTKYIGHRIARKLNELNFVSGIFDHVYVYLSPMLAENEMKIQEMGLDERLKSVHYGIKPSVFNSLSEPEKDKAAKEIAFKVLYLLFPTDNINTKILSEVEALINKYNSEIEIYYKVKETNSYKVVINYQIRPDRKPSRIIIKYLDKKENKHTHSSIDLIHHEDIYSLVDSIVIKDNAIVLNPKKSNIADLLAEKYKMPLTIEIANLKN